MTGREKIIIALMVMAGIYGAYSLFFASPSSDDLLNPKMGVEDVNQFVVEVTGQINKDVLSEVDTYAIKKATAPWKNDPFFRSESALNSGIEREGDDLVLIVDFTYTGYIQMGDKMLAIINGLEYETGDTIDPGGYIVRSISPSRVELNAEKNETIILKLDDTT